MNDSYHFLLTNMSYADREPLSFLRRLEFFQFSKTQSPRKMIEIFNTVIRKPIFLTLIWLSDIDIAPSWKFGELISRDSEQIYRCSYRIRSCCLRLCLEWKYTKPFTSRGIVAWFDTWGELWSLLYININSKLHFKISIVLSNFRELETWDPLKMIEIFNAVLHECSLLRSRY